MPITERLMKAGQWSLKLDSETPKATRDLLDFFGHVYVFDSPPRPGQSDATMITTSRWGGIVRRRQTPWDVSGVNMLAWLGDEDGKGPILEASVGGGANDFHTFSNAVLAQCPAVTDGAHVTSAGTSTLVAQWITARAALDAIAAILGMEYRVNKDATLDAAPIGNTLMFKQTPTAVAMRNSSGRDLNVTGLSVTNLGVAIDSEEYITRALVQDITNAWTGSTGAATAYKNLKGSLVNMTKVTKSPLTPNAGAATLAANLVAAGEVLRNEVTLSTDEFDIDRDVIVGDWIWVYDQESNMVDTTNPVRYRGSTIYPIKFRVLATTWPIERGMSVWYRASIPAVTWTDLSDYVVWESPGATFEVGAASRALLTTP